MLNKLLYERMYNMYDSELNRIYTEIDRKTGDIMSGDIPCDMYDELEQTLTKLAGITQKLISFNFSNNYHERLFYCTESQELVSLSDLRKIWDDDPELQELHEGHFYGYVKCCQSHNNGTLYELDL